MPVSKIIKSELDGISTQESFAQIIAKKLSLSVSDFGEVSFLKLEESYKNRDQYALREALFVFKPTGSAEQSWFSSTYPEGTFSFTLDAFFSSHADKGWLSLHISALDRFTGQSLKKRAFIDTGNQLSLSAFRYAMKFLVNEVQKKVATDHVFNVARDDLSSIYDRFDDSSKCLNLNKCVNAKDSLKFKGDDVTLSIVAEPKAVEPSYTLSLSGLSKEQLESVLSSLSLLDN